MDDTRDIHGGRVENLLIEDELKESYLTYAMSVIVSRALPDARDGLKPSQRRVLLAMNDLNLGPRSKHRKCAKICGDTSGNYHPHGESVIYPTLARMAQYWNTRYKLIDGQGNFGSVDPDPPAAMRYTEARMTGPTVEMFDDLERDTVDMIAQLRRDAHRADRAAGALSESCSSMARRASPSAWRRRFRRTTSAKSATRWFI